MLPAAKHGHHIAVSSRSPSVSNYDITALPLTLSFLCTELVLSSLFSIIVRLLSTWPLFVLFLYYFFKSEEGGGGEGKVDQARLLVKAKVEQNKGLGSIKPLAQKKIFMREER